MNYISTITKEQYYNNPEVRLAAQNNIQEGWIIIVLDKDTYLVNHHRVHDRLVLNLLNSDGYFTKDIPIQPGFYSS